MIAYKHSESAKLLKNELENFVICYLKKTLLQKHRLVQNFPLKVKE